MQFVTRAQWGAVPPSSDWTYIASTDGVKIHYEGTEVPADLTGADQHGRCAGRVRDIQASHMANTSEGWIDIAYNAVVCPHGSVFEGRGLHHKTGANGNSALNAAHYAVCAMVGDSGLTEPTDDMLGGLRDAIEWFQQQGGAGDQIEGHRDGYATDCPGDPLYGWVEQGAPRPGGSSAPRPTPAPQPPANSGSGPDWPGEYLRMQTPMLHDSNVSTWQQRMSDRGWRIAVDGWYGPQSAATARAFQDDSTAHGWPLVADGIVGPATWRASWDRPVS
ncbi:peptidoglycan recognition protein family protein [Kitasatospora sp. HPMI-4]|uniref:peptidoglycan recognition protein family protein n=1 Tax=Kitasatospora sp. HPMI-4 TaxID=3448443 RepID=UPI003F1CDADF